MQDMKQMVSRTELEMMTSMFRSMISEGGPIVSEKQTKRVNMKIALNIQIYFKRNEVKYTNFIEDCHH